MEPIKCFFVEPTGEVELYLRRYVGSDKAKCPGPMGYHDAMKLIGDAPAIYTELHGRRVLDRRPEEFKDDDPRWPTECICGYKFQPDDNRQIFQEQVYVRRDTGEEFGLRHLPAGAMYFADWMLHDGSNRDRGPDNHSLVVMVPSPKTGKAHCWHVDSRCNNCDLPDDDEHKCWVRRGDPTTGIITVDKNGKTCGAGGGSIQTDDWHGMLTDGILRQC
jgi:hypothetical protein